MTGQGEGMIRICAAKTAVDAVRRSSPEAAARETLGSMLARTAKRGGAIVIARDGAAGLARTAGAMSWAHVAAPDATQAREQRQSGA
jgi:isoaspartyl peptidase/L-asparaginase-like protein (Ntn-hydrolase superfamily)